MAGFTDRNNGTIRAESSPRALRTQLVETSSLPKRGTRTTQFRSEYISCHKNEYCFGVTAMKLSSCPLLRSRRLHRIVLVSKSSLTLPTRGNRPGCNYKSCTREPSSALPPFLRGFRRPLYRIFWMLFWPKLIWSVPPQWWSLRNRVRYHKSLNFSMWALKSFRNNKFQNWNHHVQPTWVHNCGQTGHQFKSLGCNKPCMAENAECFE